MRRQSLWVEIGLSLALLTLLVSILDLGVFMLATRELSDETAADMAEQGAATLAAELSGLPREDWGAVVDRYRRGGIEVTVYDPQGTVLAGAAESAPRQLREAIALRRVSPGKDAGSVFAVAPIGGAQPLGGARVELARAAVGLPGWGVVGAHALVSALAIVFFGLFLFRRSVVAPFDRLRESTLRIAGGEFGARVEPDGPREVAEMAGALNTMSVALAEYRRRTAEQVGHLEAANAELHAAQDALVRSEKLASVGRLAAGLAHELGNPLAAVRGYLELLQAPGADPEWVTRARVEAERMHGLLRNLLDFARLDPRSRGPVHARELLRAAADTVRPQAAFRGVELQIVTEGDPVVQADAALLHQVLVNLLMNAADAGAKLVRLRAVGGAEVRLLVEDDGQGILPEHLPRLFEPFFTTRPVGKGTGLGLAIALRIVEQHGGRIEVRSQPGAGAALEVVLPASPVDTM